MRDGADAAKTRLLVGHNPSIGETASHLATTGDRRALSAMAVKFPTSALAVIDFGGDRWSEIEAAAGRLVHFVTPAGLGDADK